ncbi:hypothetical protein [Streptomyces sp. NPDC088847]|uniref:hypothetical protein n=1 Tax=Streptomyces sp. NPDC088847 TaxID=3365909 RepID=UPI0038301B80
MFALDEAEPPEEKPFWTQRGWITSAIFLAATLLVSAITYGVSGGSSGPESGKPISVAAKSDPLVLAAKASGTARPAGCKTDDTNQALPKSAPADVHFRRVGAVRVPTSPSAGPLKTNGPVAWCYAHNPMGAVMAAQMITSHMSGPDWRTVVDEQLVPGRPRDSFSVQRAMVTVTENDEPTGSSYAGFNVADYSRKAVQVQMLIKSAQNGLVSTTVAMRWSGGDWKVAPASDGSLYTPLSQETGPGRYLLWKV